MKVRYWITLGCMASLTAVRAQKNAAPVQTDSITSLEEVVVSDSRFALKRSFSGKQVIRISREEIERFSGGSLAQLLNLQTGMEMNGSRGNPAQNLSYFVRGGNNRQVLVIIDGVQVNDPSQIASDFDLRLLDLDNIEQIEVLKGASSTLYGNAAAAAVINITTRKVSVDPIHLSVSSAMGTLQTAEQQDYDISEFSNGVNLSGTVQGVEYRGSFSHYFGNGFSAVPGSERDAFNRYNLGLLLGYQGTAGWSFKGQVNLDRFKADFDNSYPLEDAPFYSISRQIRYAFSPKWEYRSGDINLNAAFNSIERSIVSNYPEEYKANSLVVDLFNRTQFGKELGIIAGLNVIRSSSEFGENFDFSIVDPYLNGVWTSSWGLNLNAGLRLNHHSKYGEHLTFNFNPSFHIALDKSWVKFFGSYSSAYIAPSLTQLFGPYGANPGLKPESNLTWEQGIAYEGQKIKGSVLYFLRKEENFIGYRTLNFETFEGQYYNVENIFSVSGVEAELRWTPTEELQWEANYAFTENRDQVALRIPKHKVNSAVSYQWNKNLGSQLSWQYTGKRLDTDFTTFETVTLEGFHVFNLGSQYRLGEHWTFEMTLENLLNEDYAEVTGYQTRGRNVRAGVRVQF